MLKKITFALIAVALLAFVAIFYSMPYITSQRIERALLDEDADALSRHIDFPSLRESLKAILSASTMNKVFTPNGNDSSSAFGAALTGYFTNSIVDSMVTPENLSQLMKKSTFFSDIGKRMYEKNMGGKSNFKTEIGYEDFENFAISINRNSSNSPLKIILHRNGFFTWKISSIRTEDKGSDVPQKIDTNNNDAKPTTEQSLEKDALEILQAEKEIVAKNAESIEEIIAPPPLPAAQIEESPPLGHCKSGEVTYFSCQAKSSGKFISICGSKFFDDKLEKRIEGAWIQYRFGELNKTELAYPLEKIGSIDKFTTEYQKHHHMQSYSLGFKIGNNEYNIDIDESAEREFYGISLNANGKKIEIPCKDYPQSSDQATSSNNFRGLVIELNNSN